MTLYEVTTAGQFSPNDEARRIFRSRREAVSYAEAFAGELVGNYAAVDRIEVDVNLETLIRALEGSGGTHQKIEHDVTFELESDGDVDRLIRISCRSGARKIVRETKSE